MTEWVKAGTLEELRERKIVAVKHRGRSIAVFAEGDRLYAVDNRCPHMGFPLTKGTLKDGILTCHWHAWQFDASCGGCFTSGGSPVASFRTEVRGGDVFVEVPERDPDRRREELERGVREFSSLRLAKSAYALLTSGAPARDLVAVGARYGAEWRNDFSSGLSILAGMANLVRDVELSVEDRVQALVHGLRSVARDVEETPPRRFTGPLPGTRVGHDRLLAWFRGFVRDREEDAAERVLATVIETEPPERVESMLQASISDFIFLDEGHVLDFTNKAFELLGHVGWERAPWVLPTLVHELCTGTRHEEDMMWKQPHDLIALAASARPHPGKFDREGLVEAVLGDDPEAVVRAVTVEAPIAERALAVALAAMIRLGRFHTRNEFTDWDWAHHGVTTAAALRRMAVRAPSPALEKILVQTALYVFLARFLNIPKHPMPHERKIESVCSLEEGFDFRRPDEIDAAIYRHAPTPAQFVHLALREDLGFHGFQEVEAAIQLHRDGLGYIPMAAAARFLAAHSPTARSVAQTVRNAIRLQKGEILYEEES